MKNLLALILVMGIPITISAQVGENTTPPPFTEMRQEFGGDGSVYTLAQIAGHQVYYSLPYDLDFTAGWGIQIGKRTRELDNLFTEVPAWGGSIYLLKYLGGDGAFIRFGLRGIFDSADRPNDQQFRLTGVLSIGFRTSN